jgi:hypothetical protein
MKKTNAQTNTQGMMTEESDFENINVNGHGRSSQSILSRKEIDELKCSILITSIKLLRSSLKLTELMTKKEEQRMMLELLAEKKNRETKARIDEKRREEYMRAQKRTSRNRKEIKMRMKGVFRRKRRKKKMI